MLRCQNNVRQSTLCKKQSSKHTHTYIYIYIFLARDSLRVVPASWCVVVCCGLLQAWTGKGGGGGARKE